VCSTLKQTCPTRVAQRLAQHAPRRDLIATLLLRGSAQTQGRRCCLNALDYIMLQMWRAIYWAECEQRLWLRSIVYVVRAM
jgi:hypothetical protein